MLRFLRFFSRFYKKTKKFFKKVLKIYVSCCIMFKTFRDKGEMIWVGWLLLVS